MSSSAGGEEADTPTRTLGVEPPVDRMSEEARAERSAGLSDRYELLARLGHGGMGEVWRALDRRLGRRVALKLIRARLAQREAAVERFEREALATARLQHPGIVPVYDYGRLEDGRLFYTMKEVQGRTLSTLVALLHAASPPERWGRPAGGWTFRRLLDAWRQVCEALAYAHSVGVIHRDLKPDNIMVGAFGEVLVMDWGLVKLLDRSDLPSEDVPHSPGLTRAGMGTAGFMAPEQAQGATEAVGTAADIHALGAMLMQLLTGAPPAPVARQPVEPPSPRIPRPLYALARCAMQEAPSDRPDSVDGLARELQAWLDGSRRRERALAAVEEADAAEARATELREQAERRRAAAEEALASLDRLAPEEQKAGAWEQLEHARSIAHRAELAELEVERRLSGALQIDPTLPEGHARLVARSRRAHQEAEAGRDRSRALRAAARLRAHSEALPREHPTQAAARAYLTGDGALSLRSDPPGAEVRLYRYERFRRRLVPRPYRILGSTPLHALPLPMGSYVCELRHPERATVRYPVCIRRQEHWHGIPPGGREAQAVWLPPPEELGAADCYMPAGWYQSGGDPEALNPRPARRVWIDAWVLRRFPVTTGEYLDFLGEVAADGREEQAFRWAPRERGGSESEPGPMTVGYEEGRFVCRPDADGDVWDRRMPVLMVDAHGADACAAWHAARNARPWQLLPELVWEKAARGVDGRHYPWGDEIDPTWACYRDSHVGRALPVTVEAFPVDCSVYGVRGMAGNLRTWCEGGFRPEGPLVTEGRPAGVEPDAGSYRSVRGGSWHAAARVCRAASRTGYPPGFRSGVSLRIGRRVGPEAR